MCRDVSSVQSGAPNASFQRVMHTVQYIWYLNTLDNTGRAKVDNADDEDQDRRLELL